MNAVRFVWGHLISGPKDPDQELYVDEESGLEHKAEEFDEDAGAASRVSGWVPGLRWLRDWRSPLRHSAVDRLNTDSSGHGRRSMLDRYLLDQTGLGEHAGGDAPSGESSETGAARRVLDERGGSSDGSCGVRITGSMASEHDTQGMVVELPPSQAPPKPPVWAIPARFLGYKLNLVLSGKAHEPEADTRVRVTLWGWSVGLRASPLPPPADWQTGQTSSGSHKAAADAGPVDRVRRSSC